MHVPCHRHDRPGHAEDVALLLWQWFDLCCAGLVGAQSMAVRLLYVTGRKKSVICGEELPLTHRSALAWIG